MRLQPRAHLAAVSGPGSPGEIAAGIVRASSACSLEVVVARTGYDPLFACPGMVEDDYYRFLRSRPTDPGSSTTSGQPFANEAC